MHRAAVERFNARRDLEWRRTPGLWGGVVLAANALKDEELRPGWHWKWLLVAAGAGLAVLLHAYWEWKYVSRSAMRDRDDAVTIDNTLRELVNVAPVGRSGEYRSLVAHGWQVGVTLLLALVLIVVVTD